MRKMRLRRLCVVLSNRQRLECTVDLRSTGRHVVDHVTLMCGARSLHLFGLAVVIDNEYLFVDLDQKLGKYFGRKWWKTSQTGTFVLFLRVQHYVESNSVQLIEGSTLQELYYSDLRGKVLDSLCDHQEALFFQLAAAALQAEMGDAEEEMLEEENDEEDGKENKNKTETKRQRNYFLPEDYFPSWLIKRHGRDYLLQHCPALHSDLRGLSHLQAVQRFIEGASGLQDAPVTVYTLRRDKEAVRECVQLGVTLKGLSVHLQDVERKPNLLYDCTWKEIHQLTIRGRRFEVQTGGSLGVVSRLVCYTPSPCHSRLILRHIRDTHRFQMTTRRTQQPEPGAHAGQLYGEAYICDLAWLGERLHSARRSSGDSFTTYISENHSNHTTIKPWVSPRDEARRSPPVIAEVEMSVDDPLELLVDGDGELVDGAEEVLVDDPAQVQWLAGWPWGVGGVVRPPQMAPFSSCWAEITMEMKQVLNRTALTEMSVD